jgi:hypothetical protein
MSRRLVPMPTKRAPRPEPEFDEPVFIEQEPVISHQHRMRTRQWNRVPYPYQFKWDGGWLFVLFLFTGGFAFRPLWLLAGFIAAMRVLVWLCFRFPMTMVFVTGFLQGLFGGRRRRW